MNLSTEIRGQGSPAHVFMRVLVRSGVQEAAAGPLH